mgnify:FL=1
MDYQLFLKCLRFADSYKIDKPNIYYFVKHCTFQRILNSNGNRFPNMDSQYMYNAFQMEINQAQWKLNNIQKQEYHQFLEEFFKKLDFNKVDLETCEILKALTENMGIFGNFDQLTGKRIEYFNDKIKKYKTNPQNTINVINIFNLIPQPQIMYPKNQPFVELPDAEGNKGKKGNDPEMEKLNNIMKQMKASSHIYITNVQPGQFYNPYINPNYIPNGVNTNIPLPMRRNDPNYHHLKAIIEKELILANQELDYHKIDMARNHLEIAAYYLKNVID